VLEIQDQQDHQLLGTLEVNGQMELIIVLVILLHILDLFTILQLVFTLPTPQELLDMIGFLQQKLETLGQQVTQEILDLLVIQVRQDQ
jgi:hypothetical protein